MPILPSTLEYSKESFQKKIDLVAQNINKFKTLGQQKELEFHIDLVYPGFAKDRAVMSSITLTDNYKIIESLNLPCKVTIHFMGLLDDVELINKELKQLKLNPKITSELYIPINLNPKMIETKIPKYYWFDVDECEQIINLGTEKILYMTVFAGKSGQVLTQENKTKALAIIKRRGVENVIVDGGWATTDCIDGLRMVSYSSFWKQFINV
jgi:hypothetical protein